MGEATKCAEFAMLAEAHRRAGRLDQAEQMVRSGLDAHPDCAEGALVLALVLFDQHRIEDAHRVIANWTDANLGMAASEQPVTDEAFGAAVSDGELETAFESAETDRDQVIDADTIAQQAVSEAEMDLADEFASPDSSFATRTVADLLAQQGDEKRASQIRAMMNPSTSDTVAKTGNRNARKIERLERWLTSLRGEMQ